MGTSEETHDGDRFGRVNIDREDVMQALRECIQAGERDEPRRGATSASVADRMDIVASTAASHLRDLIENGRVEKVQGFPPGESRRPRVSYLPADHEDAPSNHDSEQVTLGDE